MVANVRVSRTDRDNPQPNAQGGENGLSRVERTLDAWNLRSNGVSRTLRTENLAVDPLKILEGCELDQETTTLG
jgi:hypothetical protein